MAYNMKVVGMTAGTLMASITAYSQTSPARLDGMTGETSQHDQQPPHSPAPWMQSPTGINTGGSSSSWSNRNEHHLQVQQGVQASMSGADPHKETVNQMIMWR